jgi:hypothetical protein
MHPSWMGVLHQGLVILQMHSVRGRSFLLKQHLLLSPTIPLMLYGSTNMWHCSYNYLSAYAYTHIIIIIIIIMLPNQAIASTPSLSYVCYNSSHGAYRLTAHVLCGDRPRSCTAFSAPQPLCWHAVCCTRCHVDKQRPQGLCKQAPQGLCKGNSSPAERSRQLFWGCCGLFWGCCGHHVTFYITFMAISAQCKSSTKGGLGTGLHMIMRLGGTLDNQGAP